MSAVIPRRPFSIAVILFVGTAKRFGQRVCRQSKLLKLFAQYLAWMHRPHCVAHPNLQLRRNSTLLLGS